MENREVFVLSRGQNVKDITGDTYFLEQDGTVMEYTCNFEDRRGRMGGMSSYACALGLHSTCALSGLWRWLCQFHCARSASSKFVEEHRK